MQTYYYHDNGYCYCFHCCYHYYYCSYFHPSYVLRAAFVPLGKRTLTC